MKNFFIVLVFVVFGFGIAHGQITFDGAIPALNPGSNSHYLSIVRFGYMGDKYVLYDNPNNLIQIFGLNQALEKTITVPSFISGSAMYFITDNLFDLDSSVEYLSLKFVSVNNYHVYVVKEDSNILLSRDSVPYLGANSFATSAFNSVYPTTSGTKLVLKQNNDGYDVYSLPGNIPCYECSNGVFTGNFAPTGDNGDGSGLSNPYPNPTNNLTRIDYQLPNGIKQGELVFYNTVGNEVKRFKVTNTFSFIYVSAHDLPSGTYYYNLQTSAGASDGKKMVVIR